MIEAAEDTREAEVTLAVEEAAMIATNRRKNLEGILSPVFQSSRARVNVVSPL